MRNEMLSFDTANGPASAYAALPDADTRKAVIVIHEWWGLNDHIKDIANRYASEGFVAVAPDLYRGKIAADISLGISATISCHCCTSFAPVLIR